MNLAELLSAIKVMQGGNWELHHNLPSEFMTENENKENAWHAMQYAHGTGFRRLLCEGFGPTPQVAVFAALTELHGGSEEQAAKAMPKIDATELKSAMDKVDAAAVDQNFNVANAFDLWLIGKAGNLYITSHTEENAGPLAAVMNWQDTINNMIRHAQVQEWREKQASFGRRQSRADALLRELIGLRGDVQALGHTPPAAKEAPPPEGKDVEIQYDDRLGVKKPWLAVTPTYKFTFAFKTEGEACAFQRGWRMQVTKSGSIFPPCTDAEFRAAYAGWEAAMKENQ